MKKENNRVWYQRGYNEGVYDTEKAFGGCRKCYGKGYSTERVGGASEFSDFGPPKKVVVEGPHVRMNFCTCERGKQLKKLVEPKNLVNDKSNRHLQ